jgi:hypothetical protein
LLHSHAVKKSATKAAQLDIEDPDDAGEEDRSRYDAIKTSLCARAARDGHGGPIFSPETMLLPIKSPYPSKESLQSLYSPSTAGKPLFPFENTFDSLVSFATNAVLIRRKAEIAALKDPARTISAANAGNRTSPVPSRPRPAAAPAPFTASPVAPVPMAQLERPENAGHLERPEHPDEVGGDSHAEKVSTAGKRKRQSSK